MTERPTTARVRRYYDRNTRAFLLGTRRRAIHRELWGPGVGSVADAVEHAHDLVLAELGDARRVLDLGCGVGATAQYLAERRPVDVVGVTLSSTQARLAEEYAGGTRALQGTTRFLVDDFTDLPADLGPFDLAYAIESFVHADPAASFFREAARVLRPGGALLVIDDVLTGEPPDPHDPRLADVRTDWHAATLVSPEQAAGLAAEHGLTLVADRDLSDMQRLGRPRDRLIRLAQPLLRAARGRSTWAQSMVGGDALQRCHRAGLLGYHLLRFERRAP